MDDNQVARYWNENARNWTEGVRAGYDVYREYVNNPAFFALLPDLSGNRVLDIGCGEGYNTRILAKRGAVMVGVDISSAMIDAARAEEHRRPLGIEYHLVGGNELGRFENGSFDAVISTMAIMDMADYTGCVREVNRVLKSGGLFQFSITHSCTMTRTWQWVENEKGDLQGVVVGNYFGLQKSAPEKEIDQWYFTAAPPDVREKTKPFRVPRFFRTLSEYFNTLTETGFKVDRLVEPFADETAVEQCPNVADTRIVPYFLIFQSHKAL